MGVSIGSEVTVENKADIQLDKVQGLIAGDGELPVEYAKSAARSGFEVIAIALSGVNANKLKQYCKEVLTFGPGELQKISDTLVKLGVKQLTFIGKVGKGVLFRNPRLDSRALNIMKNAKRLNDDQLMLLLVEELKKDGIDVIDQTVFIKNLLVSKGTVGSIEPTETQLNDIEYGFSLAKEIGRLDIGQTVVVQDGMVLAVEAIEGTDIAIERGCKLGSGKSVVVKVSKPSQDKRFDIPAVGMKTLKSMKKHGANVLAIEAAETFIVEKDKMIKFANTNNIVIVAI